MHKDLYRTILIGIAVCLVALITQSCGISGWNARDKWLLAGSTVAMGFDVHSTDRAINAGYHEAGLPKYVIGEKPNTSKLIAFGVGSQIMIITLADWFEDWRPWLLGMTGGVHAGTAIYNYTEVE